MPQLNCKQGKPRLCEHMQLSAERAHVKFICFNTASGWLEKAI